MEPVVDSVSVRLGEGEYPPEFDRVSWPAFFAPFLWIIANRVWPWLAVFIGFDLVAALLFGLFGGTWARFFMGATWLQAATSPAATDVLRLVILIISWLLPAYFAARGNRMRWMREAASSNASETAAHYLEYQRRWTLPAVVFFVVGLVYRLEASGSSHDVLTSYSLGAAVIAVLWVWDRSRKADAARMRAS